MKHHCHVDRCPRGCPPRWLMCSTHWAMVPPELQAEIYRAVALRGKRCDQTWAPWWRAQERAISGVLLAEGRITQKIHDARILRADLFADGLEERAVPK